MSYVKGAELPDQPVTWLDENGAVINFSTGYTFTVKVGFKSSTALFTKTTGITGSASAPNLVIAWATSGELANLTPDVDYVIDITANETASGKDRKMQAPFRITDAVT